MNRGQLIALWVGIAVFVLMGLSRMVDPSSMTPEGPLTDDFVVDVVRLFIGWGIVLAVTAGAMVTFRDRAQATKPEKPGDNEGRAA